MKAIYKGELYFIEEVVGDYVNLTTGNPTDEIVQAHLGSQELIVDPTDEQLKEIE